MNAGPLRDLLAIAKGMGVTLRTALRAPVTLRYPEQRPDLPARHRGRHELERHENGLEKCVGCELCALVCPADAIYVEGAENPKDAPVSIGERYAKTYVINLLRCIYCGYCVEACPTEALQMKGEFELAAPDQASLIVTKEQLLATLPKREPEDSWLPG
ncbi:MAG TPA: NADH-quinone oxidoreductase subunit NuoI [Candidatus Acidoferrales bacterium]|nr:NADH-quinone oxidoreductase subunit NuoI [Candidatus Acidoferrales bacterium]